MPVLEHHAPGSWWSGSRLAAPMCHPDQAGMSCCHDVSLQLLKYINTWNELIIYSPSEHSSLLNYHVRDSCPAWTNQTITPSLYSLWISGDLWRLCSPDGSAAEIELKEGTTSCHHCPVCLAWVMVGLLRHAATYWSSSDCSARHWKTNCLPTQVLEGGWSTLGLIIAASCTFYGIHGLCTCSVVLTVTIDCGQRIHVQHWNRCTVP